MAVNRSHRISVSSIPGSATLWSERDRDTATDTDEGQQRKRQHSIQALRGVVCKLGAGTLVAFILAIVALALSSSSSSSSSSGGGAEAQAYLSVSAAASAAGLNRFQAANTTVVVETTDDLVEVLKTMARTLEEQAQLIKALEQQMTQKIDSTSTRTSTTATTTTATTTTTTLYGGAGTAAVPYTLDCSKAAPLHDARLGRPPKTHFAMVKINHGNAEPRKCLLQDGVYTTVGTNAESKNALKGTCNDMVLQGAQGLLPDGIYFFTSTNTKYTRSETFRTWCNLNAVEGKGFSLIAKFSKNDFCHGSNNWNKNE